MCAGMATGNKIYYLWKIINGDQLGALKITGYKHYVDPLLHGNGLVSLHEKGIGTSGVGASKELYKGIRWILY